MRNYRGMVRFSPFPNDYFIRKNIPPNKSSLKLKSKSYTNINENCVFYSVLRCVFTMKWQQYFIFIQRRGWKYAHCGNSLPAICIFQLTNSTAYVQCRIYKGSPIIPILIRINSVSCRCLVDRCGSPQI